MPNKVDGRRRHQRHRVSPSLYVQLVWVAVFLRCFGACCKAVLGCGAGRLR